MNNLITVKRPDLADNVCVSRVPSMANRWLAAGYRLVSWSHTPILGEPTFCMVTCEFEPPETPAAEVRKNEARLRASRSENTLNDAYRRMLELQAERAAAKSAHQANGEVA